MLVVAALVVSGWASGWHRFTWGARLGTFGCGLAVVVLGLLWERRRVPPGSGDARRPEVHGAGAALWLAVVAVAAAWDVLGLLTPPDRHHLTLSAIELAYRPLHAALFACWLAIGWVLARTPVARRRR